MLGETRDHRESITLRAVRRCFEGSMQAKCASGHAQTIDHAHGLRRRGPQEFKRCLGQGAFGGQALFECRQLCGIWQGIVPQQIRGFLIGSLGRKFLDREATDDQFASLPIHVAQAGLCRDNPFQAGNI